MIKKWNEFIREFVESESFIDAKMSELRDLVDGATDGNNIIATRFASKNNEAIPLYYNINHDNCSIIIASEMLFNIESTDWHLLPQNSYLTVGEMPLKIQVKFF